MKTYGLVSNYTINQFKVHKSKCNNDKVENIVNREFKNRDNLDVVVSDLTYVNVAGKHKDAQLVYDVFLKTSCNLSNINIFHTDRGNEFKIRL